MKSRSVTLFGLPTLLTVFIVITVLSFSTLSLLSANSDRNVLRRTTGLIATSYAISTMAEEKLASLSAELSEMLENEPNIDEVLPSFLNKHPEITYNSTIRTLEYNLELSILRLDVKLRVNDTGDSPRLTRISYRLTTENGQDYSENGDPVWGG